MARRTLINHVVIAMAFTLVVGAFGAWKTESVLAATPKATVPCWSANGSPSPG